MVGRIRGDAVQSNFPSICFLQHRKGLMRSRTAGVRPLHASSFPSRAAVHSLRSLRALAQDAHPARNTFSFSLHTGLRLQVQIPPLKFSNSLTQDKPLHLYENLFPHLSNGISNQSNIPGLLEYNDEAK